VAALRDEKGHKNIRLKRRRRRRRVLYGKRRERSL